MINIYLCVCVCLALDFIAACPAHFSHSLLLHLCGTKERSSWRLDCYAMSRLYRVSYFRLFLSSLLKQQKQRRKATSGVRRGGGVQKFTAQWHPLCRWSSHFPREFHAFRLYCIGFHAWNSLVLRDNIMDAIRCKEWLIFRTGSLVGYNETARSRRLKPSPSALTLTCLQLYYLCARWLSGGFFTKWHGSPCSFMAQGSPYPQIPFQVTAGRWMEPGIWGCIVLLLLLLLFVCVHLFFFSPDVGTFPQGLGEIVLTTQWSVLLEPSVITKPQFTPVRYIVTITSLAHSSISLTCKNKPPKLGWN